MGKCVSWQIVELIDNQEKFIDMSKYESTINLKLQYLNMIPCNSKRIFKIKKVYNEMTYFPEWSWYWTMKEKEENSYILESIEAQKKENEQRKETII